MSVMMSYGGGPGGAAAATSDSTNSGDTLYSNCESSLATPHHHDSGIDISSNHDLNSADSAIIRTQDIEYPDVSSSSEATYSDSLSLDEYPKPPKKVASAGVVERRTRRRRSPPKATFDLNDNSLLSVYTFFKTFLGASTASTVAIDNKIEQAMDLVKSHLMFAVREEVDVLKDRIVELMDRINHLECENSILRQYASQEVLQQIQAQLPHQIQQPSHHSSTS